ncbi:D-lysine 5,6-aminomutase subunit alpha, partial [bacterium]|nr:D-lysine 5,6-aminomutase subunit alpha [bacterium]
WKEDGFIVNRAKTVLGETEKMLEEILELGGLRKAIEAGKFANIIRTFEGGKGFDGVFLKAENYSNPVMEILSKEGVIV